MLGTLKPEQTTSHDRDRHAPAAIQAAAPQISGFTLIEMAIVLLVVTLLLGGLLVPLTSQIEQRKVSETQQLLAEAKEALIGFAIANGRLPCPAAPGASGVEDPPGGGACNHAYDGFLPAVTLGLSNVDSSGYLLDGWGLAQNRIRYAITRSGGSAFTTGPKFNNQSIENLAAALAASPPSPPGLHVCITAAGINISPPDASNNCAANATLSDNAVAVIFSLGKNAATGGTSPDEAANLNGDLFFVSRAPSSVAGSEFDDMVDWLSPNLLFNRLVAAGKLP